MSHLLDFESAGCGAGEQRKREDRRRVPSLRFDE
jgi:hypothetical protein